MESHGGVNPVCDESRGGKVRARLFFYRFSDAARIFFVARRAGPVHFALMLFSWEFALLCGIVFVAYTTQAITGFGAAVITVTLGAFLYPIDKLMALLVPMSMILNVYLTVRYFSAIDGPLFLRRILPIMGAGVVIGLLLFNLVAGSYLKIMLGLMIVILSAVEFWSMGLHRPRKAPASERDPAAIESPSSESGKAKMTPLLSGVVLAAGVIHGIYASGGPLLVYAMGRLGLSRAVFRSTLSIVWLIFGAVLTFEYGRAGRIDLEILRMIAFMLPTLPVGIVLGEWVHHRIDERRFRIGVFALLFMAGLSLLLKEV